MAIRVDYLTNAYPNDPTADPQVVREGNYIAAGSTKTLTQQDHCGIVKLDTATGSVVTLPAATGSGVKFKFVVSVVATSSSHVLKVANSSDILQGVMSLGSSINGAANSFGAGATADTITLNRTTTGSVSVGEWFEAEDMLPNKWFVRGSLTATGTPATPFSATV